jgi:hypothetical protein
VLAIADTDSYLKWSAATLDALPNPWESSQVVISNPVMPSEAQIRAASSRPVRSCRALHSYVGSGATARTWYCWDVPGRWSLP